MHIINLYKPLKASSLLLVIKDSKLNKVFLREWETGYDLRYEVNWGGKEVGEDRGERREGMEPYTAYIFLVSGEVPGLST